MRKLSDLARGAITRLVESGERDATHLFDDSERNDLAEALGKVVSTADLLGRVRILDHLVKPSRSLRTFAEDDWVAYTGPHGGKGWKNRKTGDVHYGDHPLGSHAPNGVADSVRAAFPDAHPGKGGFIADVGGRRLTIQPNQADRSVYLYFQNQESSGLPSQAIPQELRAGSIDLFRRLGQLAAGLRQQGLAITYQADAKHRRAYDAMLPRAGYVRSSPPDAWNQRWIPREQSSPTESGAHEEAQVPQPGIMTRVRKWLGFSESFCAFAEPIPLTTPLEALKYFQRLEPLLGVDPHRFGPQMERQAFTLARATEETLLDRVQQLLAGALQSGEVPAARDQLDDLLDRAGVGSDPSYAEMVVRTNAADAYNTGAWDEYSSPDVQEEFPAWEYSNPDDGRSRPTHAARNGRYYPASTSFAEVRGTDIGDVAQCRCTFIPIHKSEWSDLRKRGTSFHRFSERTAGDRHVTSWDADGVYYESEQGPGFMLWSEAGKWIAGECGG